MNLQNNNKRSIQFFFQKKEGIDSSSSFATKTVAISNVEHVEQPCSSNSIITNTIHNNNETKCYKQGEIKNKLGIIKSDINGLILRERSGPVSVDDLSKLKKLQKEENTLEKEMKQLEGNRKRQQIYRDKKKRIYDDMVREDSDVAFKTKLQSKKGRPAMFDEQPELLSTILKIATFGAAADDKRRCEALRTVKTLSELTDALHREGFNIGKSTVYYHLLPKNQKTIDALKIDENGYGDKKFVKYSGPTFIGIRSGKHSKSTAYSHAKDFNRIYELKDFEEFLYKKNSLPKPVLILLVDGGPDENPRYQKTIEIAIHHFIERSLDALFIATNAPHRSAFNPVERRMAPLSRHLTGPVLLNYDPMLTITSNQSVKSQYTTLFQTISLANINDPYDKFCPSLMKKLDARICNSCHLYCASLALLNNHKKIHQGERRVPEKIKTKTILRKRNNECLAVLEESPGVEICEWLMEDNIEIDPVTIDMPIDVDCDTLPLITIKEHFNIPWENIY
ncbi:hypothetical protein PVAND_007390 [Polypedilum vanderplanki]|uniref:C2H2-type domain-containing protein n=1 Tax=Polypedilum vanderplanki TaxID=319348 RepID=A0A9J6C6J3_POLVA|nr:hypothetical protein PVAND_007390 [Polypedilum vanderplanki]